MWKLSKGVDAVKEFNNLYLFWFNATSLLKIFLFVFKSNELTVIINDIRKLSSIQSETKAYKSVKFFKRFTIGYFAILSVFYSSSLITIMISTNEEGYFHQHRFFLLSEKNLFLNIILRVAIMIAQTIINTSMVVFQSTYYIVCAHICSLFLVLNDIIHKLDNIKDNKMIQPIVKESIDLHRKILEVVEKIRQFYETIILVNFYMNIVIVGVNLTMFSNFDELTGYYVYIPLYFYEMWLFCYSSGNIDYEVNEHKI